MLTNNTFLLFLCPLKVSAPTKNYIGQLARHPISIIVKDAGNTG